MSDSPRNCIRTPFSILMASAVILAGASLAGCQKPAADGSGPAETAGKQIDKAAVEAGKELNQAAAATGKALEHAGEKMQEKAKEAQK